MTPSSVLLARFAVEAQLASAPSASGRQIDALREGTQSNKHGWRGDALERRRQQYADLVLLTRDLNPEELRVCRYRYGCVAGVEAYQRIEHEHNIVDAIQFNGEDYEGPKDEDGKPLPEGWGRVSGTRARLPDFGQIADAIPETTPRMVKRLLESARAKVAWQIKVRAFQGAIEERYE